MTIKTKTIFLSLIIISIFSVVGAVGIYAVEHLSHSIKIVSTQSLPAVRNMTLVDMMHDGVRAVVYRSIVAGPAEKGEVEAEFKEFSNNITMYLSEIEKLGLRPELNDSIKKTHTIIKRFQEDGLQVVDAALAGEKDKAISLLPAFITSFDTLAVELEKIGETIQAEAAAQSVSSQKDAANLKTLSFSIAGFGIFVSCLICYLAYLFIEKLMTGLLHITKGLKEESTDIVMISENMAHVSSKLSEASTQQAASLQETVASIDEISAMITRNADSAATSARMSEQSTSMAQKGKENTEQMMDSISAIASGNDEIIRQMQKSNTEISEIVKVIQDIGLKTQVINDIVFQTKLLSFNASVEAARAGEHGKGFAVVAEEVGNLASMSGKAATEITDMLTKSVKRVTEIVDGTKGLMDNLIRQSKDKVEQGSGTAKQCLSSLDDILGNVSSVNEMVREIATASQEQSTGVREVNKAMSELDQVTQSNSGIALESSKAADGLKHQADRLNTLVLELTRLVGNGPETSSTKHVAAAVSRGPAQKASARTQKDNVIALKRPSTSAPKAQKSETQNLKKVVGMEVKAPSNNDPRFEDA